MVAVDDIVTSILDDQAPVLVLDTCAILDLVRAPSRGQTCVLHDAMRCIAGATSQTPRCYIVLPSIVEQEYSNNIETVVKDVSVHLHKMRKSVDEFNLACSIMGESNGGVSIPLPAKLIKRLRGLAEECIKSAIDLDHQDDMVARAMQRTIQRRAPGHRGRSTQDCLVLEECVHLATKLRENMFSDRIAFMTSNTDDFCEGRRLHSDIASEFEPLSVEFCLTWKHAGHILGI